MPLEIDISTTTLPGAGSTLILSRNPQRRYLVVAGLIQTNGFWLWPVQQAGPVGFGPADGQAYVMLHRAVYGDLIFGDWYCWSENVEVYSILDAYDS